MTSKLFALVFVFAMPIAAHASDLQYFQGCPGTNVVECKHFQAVMKAHEHKADVESLRLKMIEEIALKQSKEMQTATTSKQYQHGLIQAGVFEDDAAQITFNHFKMVEAQAFTAFMMNGPLTADQKLRLAATLREEARKEKDEVRRHQLLQRAERLSQVIDMKSIQAQAKVEAAR